MNNIITFGGVNFKVIELFEPLKLGLEIYPGDPLLERIEFSNLEETGFEHYIHTLGDHHGHPHADAPNHQNFDMKDKGIEVFDDLKYKFNLACLIDLSYKGKEINGINYLVEVKAEDLEPYVSIMEEKGAVLIRTGYDKFLELNKKHVPIKIPYLTKGAAGLIAKLDNIKVVGIDSITIDACGREKPVHDAHWLLTKEKLVVESMVNLYKIPNENRNNFNLQTTPLIIDGATGGPVIAYAYIRI